MFVCGYFFPKKVTWEGGDVGDMCLFAGLSFLNHLPRGVLY